MHILNSIHSVMDAFPDMKFDIQEWREYISRICPELMSKCENDAKEYDFQKEVLPVINYALDNPEKIDCLNQNF